MHRFLLKPEIKSAVIDLLIVAGQAIMTFYHDHTFEIEIKSDNSPVTSADLASDSILTSGLQKLTPFWPIISEEANHYTYDQRKAMDYFWLLDPLDGTKEFLNHTDEFTINLALIHDERPVAGFIYIPVTGELYFAIKGHGSFQILDGNKESPIQVSHFSLDDSHLRVVSSRNYTDPRTESYIHHLQSPTIIAKGSALKFVWIAKGAADYYPRMIHIMEWDTAAGQIIIEEAGGKLVEVSSGQPLKYNKPVMINPYFIASGNILP